MSGELNSNVAGLSDQKLISLALNLQLSRKLRDKWGFFCVEGVRNFLSAVDNNWEIEAILYSEKLLIAGIARSKVRDMRRRGVRIVKLKPEEFRAVSYAPKASGVALVIRKRISSIEQIDFSNGGRLLAAESLESGGNLGSLLRTSKATGSLGFIVIGSRIDPFDPRVIRASMGSFFSQQIYYLNCSELCRLATERGIQIVGASPKAETSHFSFKFQKMCIIVLGGERKGLSENMQNLCTSLVKIPMTNEIDSLNVCVAGSLLLYEALRPGDNIDV